MHVGVMEERVGGAARCAGPGHSSAGQRSTRGRGQERVVIPTLRNVFFLKGSHCVHLPRQVAREEEGGGGEQLPQELLDCLVAIFCKRQAQREICWHNLLPKGEDKKDVKEKYCILCRKLLS